MIITWAGILIMLLGLLLLLLLKIQTVKIMLINPLSWSNDNARGRNTAEPGGITDDTSKRNNTSQHADIYGQEYS